MITPDESYVKKVLADLEKQFSVHFNVKSFAGVEDEIPAAPVTVPTAKLTAVTPLDEAWLLQLTQDVTGATQALLSTETVASSPPPSSQPDAVTSSALEPSAVGETEVNQETPGAGDQETPGGGDQETPGGGDQETPGAGDGVDGAATNVLIQGIIEGATKQDSSVCRERPCEDPVNV